MKYTYKIFKKEYSIDGGLTWHDTGERVRGKYENVPCVDGEVEEEIEVEIDTTNKPLHFVGSATGGGTEIRGYSRMSVTSVGTYGSISVRSMCGDTFGGQIDGTVFIELCPEVITTYTITNSTKYGYFEVKYEI